MPKGQHIVDRTGRSYGQLTVTCRDGSHPQNGEALWRCQCTCGVSCVVSSGKLRDGQISCGCFTGAPGVLRPEYTCQVPPVTAASHRVLKQYKCSARKRGLVWSLKDEEALDITQQNCHYCGVVPHRKVHNSTKTGEWVYNGIDRLDNNVGYSTANVVSCCSVCNHAKSVMSYAEFMVWLNRVVAYRTAGVVDTTPTLLYSIHTGHVMSDSMKKKQVARNRAAAKLTMEDAKEIRILHNDGVGSVELGRRYGVSSSNISSIVKGRIWKE